MRVRYLNAVEVSHYAKPKYTQKNKYRRRPVEDQQVAHLGPPARVVEQRGHPRLLVFHAFQAQVVHKQRAHLGHEAKQRRGACRVLNLEQKEK